MGNFVIWLKAGIMNKYVLMVTPNEFPDGDAGAVRDKSFAKIYMELGYKVYLICQNRSVLRGEAGGIEFISMYQPVHNKLEQLVRYYRYRYRLAKQLEETVGERGIPVVIHLYDAPLSGIQYLKRYAKQKGVKLVHDSVEWYSTCEFPKGKLDKAYILKERLNTKIINNQFCVIAISSYLQKYFSGKGIKATRIPVIMDMEKGYVVEDRSSNVVRITYAGSPAKKDLLENIIKAFVGLDSNVLEKLHLNIVGVSREQLVSRNMCTEQELELVEEHITVYGRVPREKVLAVLKESDFSVLVRPANERYAMAGYPTKSVEAMMNSVAMLCNLTSDLGMYLRDGENAVIVKNESVDALREGYLRVAGMSNDDILGIKRNARKIAEEKFDYRGYVEQVRELLTL